MPATPPLAQALRDWSPHLRLAHDFRTDPGFTLPPRRIDDHALLYVAAGVGAATIGRRRSRLTRGTLLALPPGIPHSLAADPGVRLHLLNLHFDPVRRADSALVHWHRDPLRPRADDPRDPGAFPVSWQRGAAHRVSSPAGYEQLFLRVLAGFPALSASGELRTKAALGELLAWLHDDARPGDRHGGHAAVALARACIDRRHGERLRLADIASAAGIGRSQLAAGFRAQLGCTVMAYLWRVRVEHAKLALAYHRLPVKEVAARAGFASLHHFTRVFARLVGQPPAAWQRLACAGPGEVSGVEREGRADKRPGRVDKDRARR